MTRVALPASKPAGVRKSERQQTTLKKTTEVTSKPNISKTVKPDLDVSVESTQTR